MILTSLGNNMKLPKEIENFLELASQEDDGKIPQDLLPREEFNVGKVVREICMSSNLFDEEKKILCDSIGDYRHGGEPFSDYEIYLLWKWKGRK